MPARQLPALDYKAVKAAFRLLVQEAGGPVAAAKITRVSDTMLSNYGNPNNEDCFAPIDVVADLEAEVGTPIVTCKLADLMGFDLVPRNGPDKLEIEHIGRHLGDVSSAMTETIRSMADAMADGRLTAIEMRRMREAAAAAHTQLSELDRDLDLAMQGKQAGLRVVGGEGI